VTGAGLFGLKDLGIGQTAGYTAPQLAMGFVISLLSGALAIRWLLVIVRRGRLHWFAAYCIAAGAAALIILGR
jgi:undecaprenyl-diphosphatase